ncbi:MAG: hypothetical protein ACM3N4_02580 [Nitrososphaerota archaeon]
MKTLSTSQSQESAPTLGRVGSGQGVLVGLVPLALLVTGVAITVLLSAIMLSLTGEIEFATRQTIMLGIVIVGLLASAVVYAIACVRVLRRVKQWQRLGMMRTAAATLWVLAASAIVVLLPVLIAVALPLAQQ